MIAKTIAVHGNVDESKVVYQLPHKQFLSLANRHIGLIHGHQLPEIEHEYLRPNYDFNSPAIEQFYEYLVNEFLAAEIIVFGHFHVPLVKYWNDCLLVNSGSIAPHKCHRSFGMLELDSTRINVELIKL